MIANAKVYAIYAYAYPAALYVYAVGLLNKMWYTDYRKFSYL